MLKKHLVVLLLMVMAVGASAQSIPSGTGRIEALGNSPFILDAATDINNNPVWVGYYRNYIFGDIGRDVINDFALTSQYAGVSFGVSKKLALGLVLNKTDDNWANFNVDTIFGPARNGIKNPIVPLKLLIGYSLSKDFHLGLAPYIAMWSNDLVSGSHEDKGSATSLGASLGAMKMMKKGWIEGVINFRMNSYKRTITDSASSQTWANDGGIQLSVDLRAWIYPKKSSKIAIVPILGFSTSSFTPKYDRTGPTFDTLSAKYSWMSFGGGVGLNWPISDDIQLAGGLIVQYNQQKSELGSSSNNTTNFILPMFNFAGETRIADWLTARMGYSRSVDRYKNEVTGTITTEGGTTTSTSSYAETFPSSDVQTVSLGSGFHFGRFSIDATVSEKWLKHGINFISGGDNTDLFGVISASYNFNTK
jgi:hypothetical protein